MRQYKIYPSLINAFQTFINETGYEKEGEKIPFVTFENLIDKINRVPELTSDAAKKGIDFENVVFGKNAEYGNVFETELVEKVRGYIPKYRREQQYIELYIKSLNTLVYGYSDCVGMGKVFDIKTTSNYEFPAYLNNPQLLYMKALEPSGVIGMSYLVTNFRDVYKEDYYLQDYDFSTIYGTIAHFIEFIENNLPLIKNLEIIGCESEMPILTDVDFKRFIEKIKSGDVEFVKRNMVSYRMSREQRTTLSNEIFR